MALLKDFPIKRMIFLILLNIFDILSTYIIIKNDWGREFNPIANTIIGWGWGYCILYKSFILVLFTMIAMGAYKEGKGKYIIWALHILIVYYLLVIINNSFWLYYHP